MAEEDKKEVFFQMRVSVADRDMLRRAARKLDMTASEFIRVMAVKAAQAILKNDKEGVEVALNTTGRVILARLDGDYSQTVEGVLMDDKG